MMSVPAFALFLVAASPLASAVDSSKVVQKGMPSTDCFLGLFCMEDQDEYNNRLQDENERKDKASELVKHIREIEHEKKARERAERKEEERKKREREQNRKYCKCTFVCGADDGSKCFDACCNDEGVPPPLGSGMFGAR